MDGLYAEARAKKKVTVADRLLKTVLIAATVLCFVIGFALAYMIPMMIGIVLLGVDYYMLPRMNVEYEYIFCDGQLDFDKISGGVKRKNVLRIDFDKLVIVAPKNSHALDGYRHNGVTVKNFSSLYEDHAVYGLVVNNGENPMLIYFEPDEKMLAAMKQKAPRKISEC